MKKWIVFLLLLFFALSQLPVAAQSAAFPYGPVVTNQGQSADGQTIYLIEYPLATGMASETVTGDTALSQKMQDYANSFQPGGSNYNLGMSGSSSGSGSGSSSGSGSGSSGFWGGISDAIDQELGSILNESVNDIMSGLKAEIESLAASAIASALDASPIGEVISLKDMLKEAFSKQQKIEYQEYKVKFEDQAAHTKLSSTFTNYYDVLNLPDKIKKIGKQVGSINTLLNSNVWTSKERQGLASALGQAADTSDLEDEVKTACNKNGTEVWMSEAERVKVLDHANVQINLRAKLLNSYRVKLTNAMTFRLREMAKNRAMSGMYSSNTSLNRYIGTTKMNP